MLSRAKYTFLALALTLLLVSGLGCPTDPEPDPPHTVSTPNRPSGETSGVEDTSYSYSTGGASCSQGHSVQYRFNWGDGDYSSWSSSTSASHSWDDAGTYSVKAQARCATNHNIESGWSSSRTVTIQAQPIVITGAFINFRIVPYQDNDYDISIHECNAYWSESTVTWNDRPTWQTNAMDMGSRGTHGDGSVWMQWHLSTALVREWYDNPSSNHGVVIWDRMLGYDPGYSTMIRFYSSETSNGSSYEPYVDLWWAQGSDDYHSEIPVTQDAYATDSEPNTPHNSQTVYSGWLDTYDQGYVGFVKFNVTPGMLYRHRVSP